MKTKTFMPDSRRPDWLIMLLYEVKQYCPVDENNHSATFSWIIEATKHIPYVKRKAKYTVFECVECTETENSLIIQTTFKHTPIVEFSFQ